MSNENVELALRSVEAWNRDGPEEAKRGWAEDYEYHDAPTGPGAKVVRGREAVAAHLEEFTTLLGGMRIVVKDARPCGNDEVVLLMEMEVHGARSGVDLSAPFAQVTQIVDGKIQRTRAFLTWEDALQAVGLAE